MPKRLYSDAPRPLIWAWLIFLTVLLGMLLGEVIGIATNYNPPDSQVFDPRTEFTAFRHGASQTLYDRYRGMSFSCPNLEDAKYSYYVGSRSSILLGTDDGSSISCEENKGFVQFTFIENPDDETGFWLNSLFNYLNGPTRTYERSFVLDAESGKVFENDTKITCVFDNSDLSEGAYFCFPGGDLVIIMREKR